MEYVAGKSNNIFFNPTFYFFLLGSTVFLSVHIICLAKSFCCSRIEFYSDIFFVKLIVLGTFA